MSRHTLSLVALVLAGCGGDTPLKTDSGAPGSTGTSCTASEFFQDADGDGFGDPFIVSVACEAPADFVDNADDCDDTDALQKPGQVWMRDADGDGFGDDSTATEACLQPTGFGLEGGDCDDQDSTRAPGLSWYLDADSDGFGDPDAAVDACGDITGAVPDASDCDDADWLIHPDAEEVCDLLDNDCDTMVDDEDEDIDPYTQVRMYEDADHDGWGTDVYLGEFCPGLDGAADQTGDCDDTDPLIHPDRLDYNDSIDSNCDGTATTYRVSSAPLGWAGMESGSFSISMDSRDLDGDGKWEVLVASVGAGPDDEGVVGYIPGDLELGDRSEWPTDETVRTWTGTGHNAGMGWGVRFAGDWNGDGVQDFMVGAPDVDDFTGAFYIVSLDDTSEGVAAALFSAEFTHTDSYFGYETTPLGDVTGDGLDDVLVAARRDSRGSNNRGSVTFIPGGGSAEDMVVHDGESTSDQYGFGLRDLGDIDGDGVLDVGIGAPYGDALTSNGGEVVVFSAPDLATVQAPGDALVMFAGPDNNARAGTALRGPGDVDGDGYDDILIGAPYYDHGSSELEDAGSAFVQLGSGTGWASTDLADAHLRMYDTSYDHDTGRFLGAPGDIDGDGRADVFVTAHKWDEDDDLTQVGRVYGVLGSHPSGTLYFPDDADLVIVGTDRNDYLGRGITRAGDQTGDGIDDVWVGASGAGSTGSIFLIEGAAAPF